MRACQECGMIEQTAFIGEPVCGRYPEERYSTARKDELAKAGCFKFRGSDATIQKVP